jgi:ubiquinone/menaquinone biosynthesis C-methylase UbiE
VLGHLPSDAANLSSGEIFGRVQEWSPPRIRGIELGSQDKAEEKAFFGAQAKADKYDVFSAASNQRIVQSFSDLSGLGAGAVVADLGCGSGAFTTLLRDWGYQSVGLDLSEALLHRGAEHYSGVAFVTGDVEALPFPDDSLDGILLSGIIHHLPDPMACACEVFRVLKPGGSFVAFDPNRLNPFMYLYRDRSSPFYSNVGVTANERPVVPSHVANVFRSAGLSATSDFIADLQYQYVASGKVRWALPIYNFLSSTLFRPKFMARFGAFVLTSGRKP